MGIRSIISHENTSIGPVLTGSSDSGIRRMIKGNTMVKAKYTIPSNLAFLSDYMLSGITGSISIVLVIIILFLILGF